MFEIPAMAIAKICGLDLQKDQEKVETIQKQLRCAYDRGLRDKASQIREALGSMNDE